MQFMRFHVGDEIIQMWFRSGDKFCLVLGFCGINPIDATIQTFDILIAFIFLCYFFLAHISQGKMCLQKENCSSSIQLKITFIRRKSQSSSGPAICEPFSMKFKKKIVYIP